MDEAGGWLIAVAFGLALIYGIFLAIAYTLAFVYCVIAGFSYCVIAMLDSLLSAGLTPEAPFLMWLFWRD